MLDHQGLMTAGYSNTYKLFFGHDSKTLWGFNVQNVSQPHGIMLVQLTAQSLKSSSSTNWQHREDCQTFVLA